MADKVHIWSPRRLATALRNRELSEQNILRHFIVFSLFFSGVASLPIFVYSSDEDRSLLLPLASWLPHAAIVYYGTWYTYQVNSKGDGKHFFERFFALTLPITIRLFTVFAILAVIVSTPIVFISSVNNTHVETSNWLRDGMAFVASIVWALVFYFYMGKYIAIASDRDAL